VVYGNASPNFTKCLADMLAFMFAEKLVHYQKL
jgi:hypothetical protein